jgi:hypothetical protein
LARLKSDGLQNVFGLSCRPFRGVEYKKIDDNGLTISVDGKEQVLPVDTVITCTGQKPLRDLVHSLQDKDKKFIIPTHLIGGADVAVPLLEAFFHLHR